MAQGGRYFNPAFSIEAKWQQPVVVKWVNGLVDANGNYVPHIDIPGYVSYSTGTFYDYFNTKYDLRLRRSPLSGNKYPRRSRDPASRRRRRYRRS